ncbi:MAG: aldo/keto reductase, partial [Spirochaetales bacterium]|nr:aldo/keto reductase [Spirochaetales bacterium]
MKYTYLGKTGIQVSELCFGTMSFGGDADKNKSKELYTLCRDSGIIFFDCANVYQKGLAEEYLGEFIAGERQDLIITTKAYFPMTEKPN